MDAFAEILLAIGSAYLSYWLVKRNARHTAIDELHSSIAKTVSALSHTDIYGEIGVANRTPPGTVHMELLPPETVMRFCEILDDLYSYRQTAVGLKLSTIADLLERIHRKVSTFTSLDSRPT